MTVPGPRDMTDIQWGGDCFTTEEHRLMNPNDGAAFLNSAQSVLPAVVVPVGYSTLWVRFNRASLSLSLREAAVNSYNSAVMTNWGIPVNKLFLHSWKYEVRYDITGADVNVEASYIWNELTFWVRNTWNEVVPDHGPVQIKDAQGTTPESRYEAISAALECGGCVPGDLHLLKADGTWQDVPGGTDPGEGTNPLTLIPRKAYDLNACFPINTPPPFPSALAW